VIIPGVIASTVELALEFHSAMQDVLHSSNISPLLPHQEALSPPLHLGNGTNISSCLSLPQADLLVQSAASLGSLVRTRLWEPSTGPLVDLSEGIMSNAINATTTTTAAARDITTTTAHDVSNGRHDMQDMYTSLHDLHDMPSVVLNYDRNPAWADALKRQVIAIICIGILLCVVLSEWYGILCDVT
jgi:hypothetical protein